VNEETRIILEALLVDLRALRFQAEGDSRNATRPDRHFYHEGQRDAYLRVHDAIRLLLDNAPSQASFEDRKERLLENLSKHREP
jgi:hypothetical protein